MFIEFCGSFRLLLQLLPLEGLQRAAPFQPKLRVHWELCRSLWELQLGLEFIVWSSSLGGAANEQNFLHRYANCPKKQFLNRLCVAVGVQVVGKTSFVFTRQQGRGLLQSAFV